MAGLKWNAQALQQLEALVHRRLDAAAQVLVGECKQTLSVPGTRTADRKFVGNGVFGRRGKVYRRGRRIYGAIVSSPGEPPRKQRGHLRRSVAWDRAGFRRRVGTNLKYGRYLELGTRKMAPRPWLYPTLVRVLPTIRRLLETGTTA